jgi:hypothetical protein
MISPPAPSQPPRTAELERFFSDISSRMQASETAASHNSSRLPADLPELEQFFAGIGTHVELDERNPAQSSSRRVGNQTELERFFAAISHRAELAEAQQRRLDKRMATGFNVFDLIEPDENKLSDVLAGLIDRKGNHGQGDLFLRLLFEQLGLPSDIKHTKKATVQREAPTYGIRKHRRRMDLLVKAGALLAIENKVDSLEQKDQVKDYLEHLRHCAPDPSTQSTLIYLTPDGRPPDSLASAAFQQHRAAGRLRCWSYPVELRSWLESCHRECNAPKICHFLMDFMSYIESTLKRRPETVTEEQDNED